MRLTVTAVDNGPPELEAQVPAEVSLSHMLPGRDRPDYWLGKLDRPLQWTDDGAEREVTHLVLAARWEGTQIASGAAALPINIAYVIDPSLLHDAALDFAKCAYVGIGTANVTQW